MHFSTGSNYHSYKWLYVTVQMYPAPGSSCGHRSYSYSLCTHWALKVITGIWWGETVLGMTYLLKGFICCCCVIYACVNISTLEAWCKEMEACTGKCQALAHLSYTTCCLAMRVLANMHLTGDCGILIFSNVLYYSLFEAASLTAPSSFFRLLTYDAKACKYTKMNCITESSSRTAQLKCKTQQVMNTNDNINAFIILPPIYENTNKNHQTDESQGWYDHKRYDCLLFWETNTRLKATITCLCSQRKLKQPIFKLWQKAQHNWPRFQRPRYCQLTILKF